MKKKIDITLRGGPPYGFRIQGGKEFGANVRIAKIEPNSKASQCDMKINDTILYINTVSTSSILHTQALALLRAPSELVSLVIERDDTIMGNQLLVSQYNVHDSNLICKDNSSTDLKEKTESNAYVATTLATTSSIVTSNFKRNSFGRNSDWYKKMFKELHVLGNEDQRLKNLVNKDKEESDRKLIVNRNGDNMIRSRSRSQSVSDLTDYFKEIDHNSKFSTSKHEIILKNEEKNGINDNKKKDEINNKFIHQPIKSSNPTINKAVETKNLFSKAPENNHNLKLLRHKMPYIDNQKKKIYDSNLSTSSGEKTTSTAVLASNQENDPIIDSKNKYTSMPILATNEVCKKALISPEKPFEDASFNIHEKDNTQHKMKSLIGGKDSKANIFMEFHVEAQHKFVGLNKKELSFKKGDVILVDDIIDENWYKGSIGDLSGIFPRCYVNMLERSTFNFSEKNICNNEKTDMFGVKPSFSQRSSNIINPNRNIKSVYNYVAIYDYKPKHEDEIKLIKGCKVHVSEKFADGWFKGTTDFDNRIGMLPGNFIKKL